jgi:AAA ATPase domain
MSARSMAGSATARGLELWSVMSAADHDGREPVLSSHYWTLAGGPMGILITAYGSSVDAWPLVGRSEELARLAGAVDAQRGAVITGPAGVGKTTLATAGLQLAQERGMSLARTTATRASRGLPFGAFASLLPPDPADERLGRGEHGELLRRYVQAVVAGAEGRPLVVFVDDAHLLDAGSGTLVHQLALTRAATVVATVRSGETAPDPVVALWKDGPAERIEVAVLDDAAIEEPLVTVLGGPVEPASVRQLAEHCQGNPLFLRELVTGAIETGALVEEVVDIWRLRGALQATNRLSELVALRLGDLTDPEQKVLELLTLGEPLDQATLAQLTDPSAVETLERRGLITSRIDGRRVQVWLGHPVYGDVVSVGISALRQRDLARARAEVVEATGARRREDTLLVASWRLIGGGGSADLLLSGASDHPTPSRRNSPPTFASSASVDSTWPTPSAEYPIDTGWRPSSSTGSR